MILSVVIVNYNVKYFLKQCLASVFGSQRRLADGSELTLDVWVVDNDSVDGSVEMVRQDFPDVHIIENHENVGFAKANNMALARCSGECLLLLNPDTIVEHDTFVQCVDFMRSHPDCGGLCVKMIDGHGRYLKESKRGFPSPEASFYKISGLIHLFPHHHRIAAYYMGHLPDDEVNEIEIMPGAFLMFSREVYGKIGGLDESYFMYGEDIDFSWRIKLAGYRNFYLPTTHIIHYKGESTRKGSMNYVYTFYNAMSIFVRKYFSGRNARLFNGLLHTAIWLRAAAAWLKRIARRVAVPVLDFLLAYGGFVLLKHLWEGFKGFSPDYYPADYTFVVIPLYILILMCSSWLNGGYDKPVRVGRIVRGMGIGVLLLLAFYSLLDESQRYSRMLLLIGSAWTLLSSLLVRLILSLCNVKGYALRARKRGSTLVVGDTPQTDRIRTLYASLGIPTEHIVTTADSNAQHLQDLIRIEHAEEVVFCGHDLDLRHIIDLMACLRTTGVEYKIAPSEGDYVIGSESILSPDELYLTNLDTISTDTCRRRKRMFDIGTAMLLLLLSPILFWFQQRKGLYFKHCLSVLVGRQTWVGYTGHRGVFSPADLMPDSSPELRERLLLRYMRHYSTATDFNILARNLNNI
ncbi:MAG: glycosyltransferase [Bacteroidales bacterium]|nr:glycosyltransferase [Bacteroidales bacterium]